MRQFLRQQTLLYITNAATLLYDLLYNPRHLYIIHGTRLTTIIVRIVRICATLPHRLSPIVTDCYTDCHRIVFLNRNGTPSGAPAGTSPVGEGPVPIVKPHHSPHRPQQNLNPTPNLTPKYWCVPLGGGGFERLRAPVVYTLWLEAPYPILMCCD